MEDITTVEDGTGTCTSADSIGSNTGTGPRQILSVCLEYGSSTDNSEAAGGGTKFIKPKVLRKQRADESTKGKSKFSRFCSSKNVNSKLILWILVFGRIFAIIAICIFVLAQQSLTKKKDFSCAARQQEVQSKVSHDMSISSFGSYSSVLEVVSLDCGGIVTMPPAGKSILLYYKSHDHQNQNQSIHNLDTEMDVEQCLWTLDSTRNGIFFGVKVKITLECHDAIAEEATISVLDWKPGSDSDADSDADGELATHELQYTAEYRSNWLLRLYLSFTSRPKPRPSVEDSSSPLSVLGDGDDGGSPGSQPSSDPDPEMSPRSFGFIVRIDVLQTLEWDTGSNWAFSSMTGRETFGPFKRWDKVSVVVSPQGLKAEKKSERHEIHFTVDSLNSTNHSLCGPIDSLYVYKIMEKGVPHRLGKLCGRITSPISYTTEHPILAVFYAGAHTVGEGFGISWNFLNLRR